MPHTPKQVATVSKTVTLGRPSSTLIFLVKQVTAFRARKRQDPRYPPNEYSGPAPTTFRLCQNTHFLWNVGPPGTHNRHPGAKHIFGQNSIFSSNPDYNPDYNPDWSPYNHQKSHKTIIPHQSSSNPVQIQFKSSLNPVVTISLTLTGKTRQRDCNPDSIQFQSAFNRYKKNEFIIQFKSSSNPVQIQFKSSYNPVTIQLLL